MSYLNIQLSVHIDLDQMKYSNQIKSVSSMFWPFFFNFATSNQIFYLLTHIFTTYLMLFWYLLEFHCIDIAFQFLYLMSNNWCSNNRKKNVSEFEVYLNCLLVEWFDVVCCRNEFKNELNKCLIWLKYLCKIMDKLCMCLERIKCWYGSFDV